MMIFLAILISESPKLPCLKSLDSLLAENKKELNEFSLFAFRCKRDSILT